jgi:hypothetical protein
MIAGFVALAAFVAGWLLSLATAAAAMAAALFSLILLRGDYRRA